MRKKYIFFISIIFFILSCQTVPITGRQQLNLVPDSTINAMSFDTYKKFISEHELSNDMEKTQMVKRAGQRIQKGVEEYFARRNMSEQLKGYKWEFNLVEDPAVNAWAMPGGKVVVYTGILSVAKDETGLAVVMGHEIAHAIAKHGNERMSQGLVVQMGGMLLSEALASNPQETRGLFLAAFGLGTQIGVLLPYSRLQESEADHMGLIFMAMAGYDPHAAVAFWQRMAQSKKGKSPPEFLSTHPADTKRINNLKRLIPEAMKYYRTP